MKSVLWFAVKFIVLTVPLTWLFFEEGRALYGRYVFAPAAIFVYDLFGAEGVKAVWRARYINVVPFVSLMLLTTGIGWRRRLVGLGVGLLVLFASHIGLNWLFFELRGRGDSLRAFLSVLSDTLPFLIWAVINRDFVTSVARHVAGTGTPTGTGASGAERAREHDP